MVPVNIYPECPEKHSERHESAACDWYSDSNYQECHLVSLTKGLHGFLWIIH